MKMREQNIPTGNKARQPVNERAVSEDEASRKERTVHTSGRNERAERNDERAIERMTAQGWSRSRTVI